MNRRELIAGMASAAAGFDPPTAPHDAPGFLELKTWKLHNSTEQQGVRVAEFLEHGLAPALARTGGATLAGAFAVLLGPDSPSYITVTEYPSLDAFGDSPAKLAADETYRQASRKLAAGTGFPFIRLESDLLRNFTIAPRVAIPTDTAGRGPRIFELRTYESLTFESLRRKIKMFEQDGEVAIFERLGMRPVFFAETIAGRKMPNLTYMLSFDSLADRDRLWAAFGADSDWRRIRSAPDVADAEVVSNITNIILRPLSFSPVR
jgi:hypothetical protein